MTATVQWRDKRVGRVMNMCLARLDRYRAAARQLALKPKGRARKLARRIVPPRRHDGVVERNGQGDL